MQDKNKQFFDVEQQVEQRITIQGDTLDDSDIYLYDKFIQNISPEKKKKTNKVTNKKTHYKRRSVNIPRIFIDNKLVENNQKLDRQEKIRKTKEFFANLKPIKRKSSKTIEFRQSADSKVFKKLKQQKSEKKLNNKVFKKNKNLKVKKDKLTLNSLKVNSKSQNAKSQKTIKSGKKKSKINDKKILKFCSKINKKHFNKLLEQMQEGYLKSLQLKISLKRK